MSKYAWVTLATNDAYSLGALVLAHSLHRVGTKYEMAVLITPGVTQIMREKLSAVFSTIMEVNVLDSKDEANLALLARPELGVTFTKLHCWRLTQYEKCVFLDADTLVVRNCDELFEREELSAAPDVGWPDCFNSGVFVYRPSQQTFASITAFAATKGSFDGGDQGLLNMYFSDWARKDISKHLPFIYNMCSTAAYSYLPAFKQFGEDVRIIHFIGITKPWLQYFDTLTGIVQSPMGSAHLQPLLQLWWNIFCEKVHPQLSPVMATSTLAPIWHEFFPIPFDFPIPQSLVCTDIQDKTQNDIYVKPPDFTEFQDPWENYFTENDSATHETEDNETRQYYSPINSSASISALSDQYSCLKSVHLVHESSLEYNKESYHKQQHNEYNSPLHIKHNQNQEQPNQFINETEQQHSFLHSNDTSISDTQPNHWQNQHSISIYSAQNHHSNESQYQHVNYDCTPHILCDDNNRLLSEKIKHQRNKSYVDDCIHYQMYNSVNNKHFTQHYEQNNYTHESLDIKADHDQVMESNLAYQNILSVKQNTEQDKNMNITDERTNTLMSTSPYPDSTPCTDFHNIATQSDPHIMDDLNSPNAGLAGALAQMTLGEPRSAEQIALEEHMRKQSWEQGHIDYMGRDSFDNIWKKICETLALAPPRLPSPPKETQKSAKTTTDKTDESDKSSKITSSIESIDEVDKEVAQTTINHTEEQSLVKNVPTTSVPKLSEKNEQIINATSSMKKSKEDTTQKFPTQLGNETLDTITHKETAEVNTSSLLKEVPQQTLVPIVSSDLVESCSIGEQKVITSTIELESDIKNVENLKITVDIEQMNQPEIKNEKHAKELSSASEILTVSPVPIQVAESVLQMEPKESMTDSQIMSQEILSSTITPIHLTEATDTVCTNGSIPSIDSAQNKEKLNLSSSTTMKDIDTDNKLSESSIKLTEASQIVLPVEQVQSPPVETSTSSSENLEISKESIQKQTTETAQENKESESYMKETTELTETSSECEKTKTLPSGKTPLRPSRAKELTASSTSVSKSLQRDSKGQEKTIKKTAKKSTEKSVTEEPAETAEDNGTEKKMVKKVVKKVIKKTKTKSEEGLDDGTEDNSSTSKQKKTVKVVKRGTKSSQTSGTETAVPETPSSSTSDVPVPPKRKTKATTAKLVTKKSDIDQ